MKVSMKKMSNTNKLNILLDNKAILIFLLLFIISCFVSPVFLSSRNLLNVIRQISVSAIVGIGFTCIIASANLDLSVGDMIGLLGAEMALLSRAGLPFGLVILIGVLTGAFCGFMNGMIGVSIGLPLFIVTLATGQIYNGITLLITHNSAVTGISPEFKALGQGYLFNIPTPIYIMVGVGIVIYLVLNKTTFGRHIIAIGGNKEAAHVSGIDTKKVTVGVYMLLGVCASVAAVVLTGRANSAQPSAGAGMALDSVAAVVIGGTPLSGGSGKVMGTVIGCLIVGTINNMLNLLGVDSNWQSVAKGLLILIAVSLDVLSDRYFKKRMEKA
ncbi:MAG TPA: ABC transporter permease [Clostridiales bacterium]|nr:ABC transporter permease [Clostridiales bacterium]